MDRRKPFQPQPECVERFEPRTQRAYTEEMAVSLECSGGQYMVHSASGNTYTVDVTAGTCTCKDHEKNDPEGGCKHRRRVELEIRSKQVPTPDGRIPQRTAADGGTTINAGSTITSEDDRIRGPIPEYNAYGNLTGAEYYRCQACGAEAMRKQDLENCCEEAKA